MITYLAGYVATLIVFIVADMAWLGTMVNRVYRPALGDIMLAGVNLPPAIVFYLLYPVGIMVFAVLPALKSGSIGGAIAHGAMLGFFAYATYDLTNYATLRNWTLQLTVIDIAWGTVLGALAAAAGIIAMSQVEAMG